MKVEIWLCWRERVVRLGKRGSSEMQRGTRDEKALVSKLRVLTVGKMRPADARDVEWKVERWLPATDSEVSDGNCDSTDPSFVGLHSMSNICTESQYRIRSQRSATNLIWVQKAIIQMKRFHVRKGRRQRRSESRES